LAIQAFALVQKWNIERAFCDSANQQSIEKLRRGNVPAREATKPISDGIRAVGARMRTGRLKIWRTCPQLIRELGLYHYDPERKLPVDEPVKEHDHAPDALRYCVMGVDRGRQPHGAAPPPLPEPEPPKPPDPDPETDYRVRVEKQPPKQLRIKGPEERWEESEDARRLQREYLEDTFESFRGFDGASGP
jgi:hypothetical protein